MKINDALKTSQENAVKAIQEAGKSRVTDAFLNATRQKSIYDKGVTAQLLNNYKRVMDSDAAVDFTKSSDVAPFVNEVWPLVAAWYPEFPLKDLISVQAMKEPLAYLMFTSLRAGTSKPGTKIGDVVETATGPRTIRGQYPTGEIIGEEIQAADMQTGASSTQAMLAYYPLNISATTGYLDKIKLTIGDKSYVPLTVVGDTVNLAEQGTTTASGITIGVSTGLIDIPSSISTTDGLTINYVWNIDYATHDNVMRVKEEIENRVMEATPRALVLEWTLFSEYLKKTQFGTDIRKDNAQRMLDLMYQYQVRYILDSLYEYSTGQSYVKNNFDATEAFKVSIPGSTTVSLDVKAQTVMQNLGKYSAWIEMTNGRVEGNRLVVGRNFKNFVETLPIQWWKPATTDETGYSSPRELGQFGKYKVFYDPMRNDNEAMMLYRGKEFYDAAYYLGEYMPIVPTEAIPLGVKVSSSFVSMEAYRYDKPNSVIKFNIE